MLRGLRQLAAEEKKKNKKPDKLDKQVEKSLSIGDYVEELRAGALSEKILKLVNFTYKSPEAKGVSQKDIQKTVFPRFDKDEFKMYNADLVRTTIADIVDSHIYDIISVASTENDGVLVPPDDSTLVAITAMLVNRYLSEIRSADLAISPLIDVFNPDHYRDPKTEKEKPAFRELMENQTKDIEELIDGNRSRLNFIKDNVDIPRLLAMSSSPFPFKELAMYVLELADQPGLVRLVSILDSKAPMMWLDKANRPKFSMAHYIPILEALKSTGKKRDIGQALLIAIRTLGEHKLKDTEDSIVIDSWQKEVASAYQKIEDKLNGMYEAGQITEEDMIDKKREAKEKFATNWTKENLSTLGDIKKHADKIFGNWNAEDEKLFISCFTIGSSIINRTRRMSVGTGALPTYRDEQGEEQQMDIGAEDEDMEKIVDPKFTTDRKVIGEVLQTTLNFIGSLAKQEAAKIAKEMSVLTTESTLRKKLEQVLLNIRGYSVDPKEQQEAYDIQDRGKETVKDVRDVWDVRPDNQDEALRSTLDVMLGAITTIFHPARVADKLSGILTNVGKEAIQGETDKNIAQLLREELLSSLMEDLHNEPNIREEAIPTIKKVFENVLINSFVDSLWTGVLTSTAYAEELATVGIRNSSEVIEDLKDKHREELRKLQERMELEKTKQPSDNNLAQKVLENMVKPRSAAASKIAEEIKTILSLLNIIPDNIIDEIKPNVQAAIDDMLLNTKLV